MDLSLSGTPLTSSKSDEYHSMLLELEKDPCLKDITITPSLIRPIFRQLVSPGRIKLYYTTNNTVVIEYLRAIPQQYLKLIKEEEINSYYVLIKTRSRERLEVKGFNKQELHKVIHTITVNEVKRDQANRGSYYNPSRRLDKTKQSSASYQLRYYAAEYQELTLSELFGNDNIHLYIKEQYEKRFKSLNLKLAQIELYICQNKLTDLMTDEKYKRNKYTLITELELNKDKLITDG